MGPWLIEVDSFADVEPWLAGGPPHRSGSSVMLVRGDGPVVRSFLPNALDAAKINERRVVVWLRAPEVLGSNSGKKIFGSGDWCIAAALQADGSPGAWVSRDRTGVEDADSAFCRAEEDTPKKVDSFDG